jgi:hypothetical protein
MYGIQKWNIMSYNGGKHVCDLKEYEWGVGAKTTLLILPVTTQDRGG